jgi:putative effector of murein hydrolase
MNPVKLIQFFILLIVNFIIVTLINYTFLVWVANKTDTTISSVLVKSAIIAVVLTVLFTFYNKKKDKTDE